MQCPAQAAFDGPERSQAEGPQRASVGLSWARGKGSRAQALFGHEPSRAWARLVQSLVMTVYDAAQKSAKEESCFLLTSKEAQWLAKTNFIEGNIGLELRSSTGLVKIGCHNVAQRMQLPRATTMARLVSDTITLGERRNLF